MALPPAALVNRNGDAILDRDDGYLLVRSGRRRTTTTQAPGNQTGFSVDGNKTTLGIIGNKTEFAVTGNQSEVE